MFKQYIPNWDIKFKFLAILLCFAVSSPALAEYDPETLTWEQFKKQNVMDKKNHSSSGWSYIISGGIAVVGGAVGFGSTNDPLARSVFVASQSLGLYALGHGYAQLKNMDTDDPLYKALNSVQIDPTQKTAILRVYYEENNKRENTDKYIKAATHGAIAVLNAIYASKEDEKVFQNALYFISGINLLVGMSFVF